MIVMRWVVLGLLLLGLGLIAEGVRTAKSPNMDVAGSAVIPYFVGGVVLVADVALVILYALYRLFT